jgi:2-polyprenyl-3-methyl-5-hydroxy-6-metoxy-1,4-benzoquinol methylase
MINRIHSLLHRPEQGWDPIPKHYAEDYAELAWREFDPHLVATLNDWTGGLAGKRVLDLAGGPGQYSVAFAKCGAIVTWHDVSRNYREIASERARQAGVTLHMSLGYLEEASKFASNPFDLVFSRVCWCYCIDDRNFAEVIFSCIKPGGSCHISTNTLGNSGHTLRVLQNFLYERMGAKIGHPHPPRGKLLALFRRYPLKMIRFEHDTLHKKDAMYFQRDT